ncbi:MAG: hypothetical protein AABX16_04300, partial [Nanoarchaeota archaeon]
MKTFIIILLSIIGLSLIFISFSPDLTLPYQLNEFRIGPVGDVGVNKANIRDYLLSYDFEKQEGELKFRYWNGYNKDYRIYISVPKQVYIIDPPNLTLSNIYQVPLPLGKKEYCSIINNKSEYSNYLDCQFKNISWNESIIFNIRLKSFEEKIYPNGRFVLVNDIKDSTGSDNYISGDRNAIAKFDLGNKYRCSEPCWVNDYIGYNSNENINYYLENNVLKIYVVPGSNNKISSNSQFRLNTH